MRTPRPVGILLGCTLVVAAAGATTAAVGETPSPLDDYASDAAHQPVAPTARSAPHTPSSAEELDKLLTQYRHQEQDVSTALAAVEPEVDVVKKRILARGRQYYRLMRAGLLPAGEGFEALVDHAANVERTRMALLRDVKLEKQLRIKQTALAAQLEQLRADRVPLEAQRETMGRARNALVQAEERRAAFARAFETSVGPADYVAVYGADLGPEVESGSGFASLRGRLPFPVAGRAEVKRVQRSTGPALELSASDGAVARSVAAGRVVFVGHLDGYGLAVMVDHGASYFTVYANLREAHVRVDENLPGGERIGPLVSEGGTATLVFEIRRGLMDALDPAPWLGMS